MKKEESNKRRGAGDRGQHLEAGCRDSPIEGVVECRQVYRL